MCKTYLCRCIVNCYYYYYYYYYITEYLGHQTEIWAPMSSLDLSDLSYIHEKYCLTHSSVYDLLHVTVYLPCPTEVCFCHCPWSSMLCHYICLCFGGGVDPSIVSDRTAVPPIKKLGPRYFSGLMSCVRVIFMTWLN